MTGLKLLADRVDAKMMSRAAAGHATSIAVGPIIAVLLMGMLPR